MYCFQRTGASDYYDRIHAMVILLLLTFDFTFGHLVGPHAHSGLAVVSQTRRTLVSAGLTSPTVPEGIALDVIGEDSVRSRTVWRRTDSRFWKR